MAIEDALQMRGSRDFDDLDAYRSFIDEIVGRRNARNAELIDAERAELKPLPKRRTEDYEDATVSVTSSGGFVLRKVFYTVPSRLIGYRLRVRLHDDRLDLFIGATHLMTLPRGRPRSNGTHGHVVNYRHVIHSLRKKPMALMNLVYRDQLFPREAYRQTFELAVSRMPERQACRLTVKLLAIAHEHGCEAELADALTVCLKDDKLPDLDVLRARFAPDPTTLPKIDVQMPTIDTYEALLGQAGAA